MHETDRPSRNVMRKLRHDMRTPLGQIIGYSEMLEEELSDRDQGDLIGDLGRIRTAARDLLALVDQTFREEDGTDASAGVEANPRDTAPSASAAPAARRVARTGKLLVVDDEAANRDLLSRRLERAGHRVACAADGREALHCIGREEFDLVLLDVIMPGMSGLEVLAAIRADHEMAELPVIMATALGASDDVVRALEEGANDYVTKPIDVAVALARVDTQLALRAADREVRDLARQLEIRNAFVRRTFGRYVSEEIVDTVLESREGLELRGEKRELSILMADLRGFSSLTESLSPTDIVSILNTYLGTMAGVIHARQGTIDEFIGDGILAFFGAPVGAHDDVERAVACAIEMQLAMAQVNEINRSRGLPEVEMGVGIATGDVIVGNIGSEQRTKYGAVGSAVNLASRIESYTLGGEILVSDATVRVLGEKATVDRVREVRPKGFDASLHVHRVVGLDVDPPLRLLPAHQIFEPLERELPVRLLLLDGKDVQSQALAARVWARSGKSIKLRCEQRLEEFSSVRIELEDAERDGCYAKVVEVDLEPGSFTLRFSTRSRRLDERLTLGG